MPARFRKLLPVFVVALVLPALAATARAPLAEWFFERALEAKQAWRLERAIRLFDWAGRLGSDPHAARLEKAVCLQLRGRFADARREIDDLAAAVHEPPFHARVLNASGISHFNLNEPDLAIARHLQSRDVAARLGDAALEADALIGLSRVLYHSKGRADEALKHLQRALRLARGVRDKRLEADALRNIGVVYWWHKGRFDDAIAAYYRPALDIYRQIGDLRGEAITLSNISLAHFGRGDLFQFVRHQYESVDLKERAGDLAALCDSYIYLGRYYEDTENYRKAIEHYVKALTLSREAGYRLGENEAAASLASLHARIGDAEDAGALLQRAVEREARNPGLAHYRLGALAEYHLEKGEARQARRYLEQIERIQVVRTPEDEVILWTALGQTYIETGDWRAASAYLSRAEQVAKSARGKTLRATFLLQLAFADLLDRQGRKREALKRVIEAAEIDSETFGATQHGIAAGRNQRLYDLLFAHLLDRPPGALGDARSTGHPNDALAFRFLEQLRYRSFRDLVLRLSNRLRDPDLDRRRREQAALVEVERASQRLTDRLDAAALERLRRAYSDYEDVVLRGELPEARYELAREARPVRLEDVQRSLGPWTALIEYVYGGEKVFALVVTHSALRSIVLPATSQSLVAKVKLLRHLITSGSSDPRGAGSGQWKPVAQDLRERLIDPIERRGWLRNVRRIGIVPFGPLHDLPFAVLSREDAGKRTFLVEDYVIFYAPSASFLAHVAERPSPVKPALISFGHDEPGGDGIGPLSFAAREARLVAAIAGGDSRVGAEASETELKTQAGRFGVIHLAAHAVSEPHLPLLSRVRLGSSSEDDGNLTVREILDLHLRSELITLSACRTGLSFTSSGQEVGEVDRLGLIEAFLNAGARRVVASLLAVEDLPTHEFMRELYGHLRSTSAADALAATQRAFVRGQLQAARDGRPPAVQHPRYWAPFILVGDFR